MEWLMSLLLTNISAGYPEVQGWFYRRGWGNRGAVSVRVWVVNSERHIARSIQWTQAEVREGM